MLLAFLFFAAYAPWNQPVEPVRITDNLYYVGTNEITSFLITTPAGHIVIDGGFEETAPIILANIRKLGFRVEDVKIRLSSHDDGDTVTLGGVTLVAHSTPGHTPGCTTWTTTLGGHEVVFVGSPSIPSEYKLTPRQIDDYRAQFKTLRALHPDIFLASHGGFFNLTEKLKTGNFVDPTGIARSSTRWNRSSSNARRSSFTTRRSSTAPALRRARMPTSRSAEASSHRSATRNRRPRACV